MQNAPFLPVFFSYCKKVRHGILALILCVGTLFLLTFLYHAPMELPLYTACLLTSVASLFFATGFATYYRSHRTLKMLHAQCNTKLSDFPHAADLVERDYQILAKYLEEARLITAAQAANQMADATQYYTLWAHQVKTPIAAMRLLLQEEDADLNTIRREMTLELFKTEQYVDMVLQYLRLGTLISDLAPQSCAIAELVRTAAKRTAPLFIHKPQLRLELGTLDGFVLTDKKWILLVLEQILTNAAKYTPQGVVRVETAPDDPHTLIISDTGIGIRAEDLPRIFERGFTGYNGRSENRSTGLGLYLCREVLQRLGHTIAITSALNQGTQVYIGFTHEHILIE